VRWARWAAEILPVSILDRAAGKDGSGTEGMERNRGADGWGFRYSGKSGLQKVRGAAVAGALLDEVIQRKFCIFFDQRALIAYSRVRGRQGDFIAGNCHCQWQVHPDQESGPRSICSLLHRKLGRQLTTITDMYLHGGHDAITRGAEASKCGNLCMYLWNSCT
jgi:hypothetical protein